MGVWGLGAYSVEVSVTLDLGGTATSLVEIVAFHGDLVRRAYGMLV
jgi:hypothetical protein